jgi:hypothetical protein
MAHTRKGSTLLFDSKVKNVINIKEATKHQIFETYEEAINKITSLDLESYEKMRDKS